MGDALTAKWLCEDLRPYAIVEDKVLIDLIVFVNTVKGTYSLKGRRSCARYIINLKCEVDYISLTTDMWTSRNVS